MRGKRPKAGGRSTTGKQGSAGQLLVRYRESGNAMSVEDRLRAFEKDAGKTGFRLNDTAITIIRKRLKDLRRSQSREVTRFLKDNISKQAGTATYLLKPNFYDELAEVFIWTRLPEKCA